MAFTVTNPALQSAIASATTQAIQMEAWVSAMGGSARIKAYAGSTLLTDDVCEVSISSTNPRRLVFNGPLISRAWSAAGVSTKIELVNLSGASIAFEIGTHARPILVNTSPHDAPEWYTLIAIEANSTLPLGVLTPTALPLNVNLKMVSSVAGSMPFAGAVAFKKGDVTASHYLTVPLASSSQAITRSIWPDGSAKIVHVAGIRNVSANTSADITVSRVLGAAPTPSSAIQKSALVALNPDVKVIIDNAVNGQGIVTIANQQVTLASCLTGNAVFNAVFANHVAGLVREYLGPVMSEFHFYRPTGDSNIAVWFYVRLWADNTCEVETVIENSSWMFNAAIGHRTYTTTITVSGAQRYTGRASYDPRTRWSNIQYLATNPQVTVLHDSAYLQGTALVPKFNSLAASAARLSAGSFNTYASATASTPVDFALLATAPKQAALGDWPAGTTAAGGENPHVGPMPEFDVLAIKNSTSQAVNTCIGHARAGMYMPSVVRDEKTGRPPLINTTYPYGGFIGTNLGSHYGCGLHDVYLSASADAPRMSLDWEHNPSQGFVAYLLTGRYSFMETAQFASNWQTLVLTSQAGGSLTGSAYERMGAQGLMRTPAARGCAWGLRALTQAAAISPDTGSAADVALRNEFVTQLGNNATHYAAMVQTPLWSNALGILGSSVETGEYGPTGDSDFDYATFQYLYISYAAGYMADIGILSGVAQIKANEVAAHALRFPVGLMGDNTGFNWRYASTYKLPYGNPNPNAASEQKVISFKLSWAQVYAAFLPKAYFDSYKTTAVPAIADTLGLDIRDEFGTGPMPYMASQNTGVIYSIMALPALTLAVKRGVLGADAAYQRVIQSSTYVTFQNQLADNPKYGTAT